MKETGILMMPENYGKCEDGSKTQTRRIVKHQPNSSGAILWPRKMAEEPDTWLYNGQTFKCPFGGSGDRLYVKESICIDHFDYFKGPLPITKPNLDDGMLVYRRDGTCCQQFSECECGGKGAPWRSPLFMPKWAARLWLEITDVRVERLQEITEKEAKKEGCSDKLACARSMFAELWNSINGPGSWDLNPWVWVLSFRRVMR